MIFWRRTGLHVRPDFRWRGVGLDHIGRLAGWTFLMVVAGQLAGLVQSRVLSDAAEDYPGVLVSQNAWLLFMLPYSIIVLSIGTPYFTQLSEHAAAGRDDDVRGDVGRSIRTLGVFIVIATAALAAAAVPASRIFTDSRDEAVAAAGVLLCFLVSLVPLAVLFVIQRTFYAYDDTRTPFFFTLLQCALVVATALAGLRRCRSQYIAAGIALGQSFASIVQVIVATWLLQRRLGGLRIGSWMLSLGRFALAAVPAAGAGWLTFLLLGGVEGWTVSDKLLGALGAAIIGVGVAAGLRRLPRPAARARTRTRDGPRAARSAGRADRRADAESSTPRNPRWSRNAARLPCVEASGATEEGAHVRQVIIIGSGPAGFTAAIYAARANLEPLVVASSVEVGGELMNTTDVENFPGFPDGIQGPDLMTKMQEQAERFGAEILYDDVVELDLAGPVKTVKLGSGAVHEASSVIFATGSAYRKLGIPGEERLSGRGVSWCATCDGFFFRERDDRRRRRRRLRDGGGHVPHAVRVARST